MACGNSEAANGGYVTSEREFELARGKVPDLDDAVARASGEPLVSRFNSNRLYLTKMSQNHTHEFPLQVVHRFY